MKIYSQNNEQQFIESYFKGRKGTFLDIGANDGETLSNTRALALEGWNGVCVEPSPSAFKKLLDIYWEPEPVFCLEVAISTVNSEVLMFDSGEHLGVGDTSLLSTLNDFDYLKWKNATDYNEICVKAVDFETFLRLSPYKKFNFISIDAEGEDLKILKQMNLAELECECICLEWNGDVYKRVKMLEHCRNYGLRNLILQNNENLILTL